MERVIIIGGGGTGAAIAHDLVLRGFDVSLFERGELLSGTTGRHHGLLHSGARYAVHDIWPINQRSWKIVMLAGFPPKSSLQSRPWPWSLN